MLVLYLTPASIGYLTQFLLALAITGYFWNLARRSRQGNDKSSPTALLASAFTAFACLALLLFLNVSLRPDLRFYTMPLEGPVAALFAALLLQAAYRFPAVVPSWRRESLVVRGASTLYVLWEAGFAVYRYVMLVRGRVEYRPPAADFPLVAIFLWTAVVFLRQTMGSSTGDGRASIWRRLLKPRGRTAYAARMLALLSLLALGLAIVEYQKVHLILPGGVTEVVLSLGTLFVLSAFALTYFNYLPETTPLMVKLMGIIFTTVLMFFGILGWVIGSPLEAGYRNDQLIPERTTLRFTPNTQGGYDVTTVSFHFESDFGEALGPVDPVQVELPFDFPFYGQVWREAYIRTDGAVSFGQALRWADVQYHYGPLPAIFPLVTGLSLSESSQGGLFLRNSVDKVVITWYRLPAARTPDARYTFQLVLYPTGVFDIAYDDLPDLQTYAFQDPKGAPWLVGAVPGSIGLWPDHVRFTVDLPFTGHGSRGFVEDYYLYFRRYLHRVFLPLAYLIIGCSVFLLTVLPLFFRPNLAVPLKSLLIGVRQALGTSR